ncbi:FAD-dependent oxidoreductase [Nocardioides sp. WS12]|uniref:FAD-dependent oxidoreductase n=1 Tax=Nocardioides sp. WS12 TaxID=2486272 RepID=UPI0015F9AFA7|nr:FAD-dependent oxidoreductase [Nocardioides sp. WS12]
MTFVIDRGCCKDAACIPVCPVQCIRPRPEDPDFTTAEQLYIDPAVCIDCGVCMNECPVDAINSEWDLPDGLEDYLDINAGYFEANPITKSEPPKPVRRELDAAHLALNVAIVGSGPAACYAAAELARISNVKVSVFDRLPTPFGLVRSGVAPDHSKTKRVAERFNAVLGLPNVRCFFNVEVGNDVSIEELLEHHHAVLWAGGADDDRSLGIPGEDLAGCHSGREFVAWYNGHPDHANHRFQLDGERVVVIGNGNVALDVARILAQPVDMLVKTDIALHSIDALTRSNVVDVVVAARRGPEHAAYTTGELLALDRIERVALLAQADEVGGAPTDPRSNDEHRAAAVAAAAVRSPAEEDRTITLRYGLSPVSINGTDAVESVTFSRGNGELETIATSLVLRAVGYRGRAVAGLPFDEVAGTFPHRGGSIYDPQSGEDVAGLYCTGWIKRGANGMIGSNKVDAVETVESILTDLASGRLPDPIHDLEHLQRLLAERQPDVVDKAGWARIDKSERRLGREAGRNRTKFVSTADLLASSRL